jgi:hypothetical protein
VIHDRIAECPVAGLDEDLKLSSGVPGCRRLGPRGHSAVLSAPREVGDSGVASTHASPPRPALPRVPLARFALCRRRMRASS